MIHPEYLINYSQSNTSTWLLCLTSASGIPAHPHASLESRPYSHTLALYSNNQPKHVLIISETFTTITRLTMIPQCLSKALHPVMFN